MDGPLITLEMLKNREIHVIGGGTLGSRCVDQLCRYRVPEVIVHDPDVFESRNRYNQIVFAEDIGLKKPDALARHATRIDAGGTRVITRYDRVGKGTELSGFVLVMVDTMCDREEILENCLALNEKVSLMVEARMGVYAGKVYGVDPNNEYHLLRWKEHWHPDDPDVLAGCKAEFPAPSTADIVAGHAMWRFLRWLHLEQGSDDPYYNYVGFSLIGEMAFEKEEW